MNAPSTATTEEAARCWRNAAGRLAQSLSSSDDGGQRLALLKRLARRFGEPGYPGFLKLLLTVAESGDARAQRQLAETLAVGLRRQDLPSGELTSWGGSSAWSGVQSLSANQLSGSMDFGRAPRRQLGPLEYLTVWFCQRTQRPYLAEDTYRESLARLIALIDRSDEARELYPLKIESDLATVREGTYTRQARERLLALAKAWRAGMSPMAIADAAATGGAASAGRTLLLREL